MPKPKKPVKQPQPEMRGDQPPELDDEDEAILDRIWDRIREEEEAAAKKSA